MHVFRDWLLYIKIRCWFVYIKLLLQPPPPSPLPPDSNHLYEIGKGCPTAVKLHYNVCVWLSDFFA